MSEIDSQEEVEAVGISNQGTVHFVEMENGEPHYNGKINNQGNITEGFETFCGEYIDLEDVFVENFDEKVDEFADEGKHFCKSCRSNVKFHRNDI